MMYPPTTSTISSVSNNRRLHEGADVLQIRQGAVDELPGADRIVKTKADALEFVVHRFADVEDQRHAELGFADDAQIAQQQEDHHQRHPDEHQFQHRQRRVMMQQRPPERLPAQRLLSGEPGPEARAFSSGLR